MKFYKEDIKYIKRTSRSGFDYTYEYQYHFSVRGESSNYLINKYWLFGKDVEIHYISNDYITVTSKNPYNNTESDVSDVDPQDMEELNIILEECIRNDLRNWEEYKCNDCYAWDTRWEK